MKITPETARSALYRIEGMIASDDGMIIENALTLWEEEREKITTAITELEELKETNRMCEWNEGLNCGIDAGISRLKELLAK